MNLPKKNRSVNNLLEFTDNLKDVKIGRNEVMASYDVGSLNPSVPIEETMVILSQWHGVSADWVEIYTDLTKVCMYHNVFAVKKYFTDKQMVRQQLVIRFFVVDV